MSLSRGEIRPIRDRFGGGAAISRRRMEEMSEAAEIGTRVRGTGDIIVNTTMNGTEIVDNRAWAGFIKITAVGSGTPTPYAFTEQLDDGDGTFSDRDSPLSGTTTVASAYEINDVATPVDAICRAWHSADRGSVMFQYVADSSIDTPIVVHVTSTDLDGAAYTRTSNTITADANGAMSTIDGVTMAVDDLVLLRSGDADAGVWIVTDLGDGSNPYTLDRASSANTSAKLFPGLQVVVKEGDDYSDTTWLHTTNDTFTLNTTSGTWEQMHMLTKFVQIQSLTKVSGRYDAKLRVFSGGSWSNESVGGVDVWVLDNNAKDDFELSTEYSARLVDFANGRRVFLVDMPQHTADGVTGVVNQTSQQLGNGVKTVECLVIDGTLTTVPSNGFVALQAITDTKLGARLQLVTPESTFTDHSIDVDRIYFLSGSGSGNGFWLKGVDGVQASRHLYLYHWDGTGTGDLLVNSDEVFDITYESGSPDFFQFDFNGCFVCDDIDINGSGKFSTIPDGFMTLASGVPGSTGVTSDGVAVISSGSPSIHQGGHIADADTSHDVTGSDQVDQASVESALNALGSKINSILSALESAGIVASS